jgi:hypothetical protein
MHSIGKYLQLGLISGVIATVINVILYVVGNAIHGTPMTVDPPGPPPLQALPIYPVILLSMGPSLIAGLLYGILKKFTAKPQAIFLVIAVIVFAVMFINPFLATQSVLTLWTLQMMHLGTAIPITYLLLRREHQNKTSNA